MRDKVYPAAQLMSHELEITPRELSNAKASVMRHCTLATLQTVMQQVSSKCS